VEMLQNGQFGSGAGGRGGEEGLIVGGRAPRGLGWYRGLGLRVCARVGRVERCLLHDLRCAHDALVFGLSTPLMLELELARAEVPHTRSI
jgi:hypothetical protein